MLNTLHLPTGPHQVSGYLALFVGGLFAANGVASLVNPAGASTWFGLPVSTLPTRTSSSTPTPASPDTHPAAFFPLIGGRNLMLGLATTYFALTSQWNAAGTVILLHTGSVLIDSYICFAYGRANAWINHVASIPLLVGLGTALLK